MSINRSLWRWISKKNSEAPSPKKQKWSICSEKRISITRERAERSRKPLTNWIKNCHDSALIYVFISFLYHLPLEMEFSGIWLVGRLLACKRPRPLLPRRLLLPFETSLYLPGRRVPFLIHLFLDQVLELFLKFLLLNCPLNPQRPTL